MTGALDQKLVDPACQLKGGDFKVSSGKTYLKSALESSIPDARNRMLRDGVRVITESISGGQSGSSAAWYWLGRNYLQQGDLVGADSAFTKVEQDSATLQSRHRQTAVSGMGCAGERRQ